MLNATSRPFTIFLGATLHTASTDLSERPARVEGGALALWGDQQLWLGAQSEAEVGVKEVLSALEAEGLCNAQETWAARSEVDCTGEHIAPVFVDAHVHLGLYPEGFVGEPKDLNELTSPLTPQLRAMDGVWPGDVAFKKAREAGVTTVCVIPGSANVVGGVGVVLKTSGVDVERISLREPACLKIAFGYNVKHNHGLKGRAPLTRMAEQRGTL